MYTYTLSLWLIVNCIHRQKWICMYILALLWSWPHWSQQEHVPEDDMCKWGEGKRSLARCACVYQNGSWIGSEHNLKRRLCRLREGAQATAREGRQIHTGKNSPPLPFVTEGSCTLGFKKKNGKMQNFCRMAPGAVIHLGLDFDLAPTSSKLVPLLLNCFEHGPSWRWLFPMQLHV